MTTIGRFMADDHRGCDEMFVKIESAVTADDWSPAQECWDRFEAAMQRQFEIEEEILFPEIEQANGLAHGPTEAMRIDHRQMRSLFQPLVNTITTKESHGFLGLSETMMVVTHQNNTKDQLALYPLAEEVIENPDATVVNMHARRAYAGT